ncbi:DUF1236 domain-containing protein [Paracoccus sp. CPCC 101403]|uniref:DUF1236 domain-containing protein n=2 Tax=Paracoccus broussonetiae TaxID=3075834 RepID=A0ABU3E8R9_9RHOB|nr:DUF1236 domain-containing protein [Paracoccus sp. CPCC 101403]MDT1060615.1 DUF1236 domain-containing protein [Paracoccus sp. CPCC 101403]
MKRLFLIPGAIAAIAAGSALAQTTVVTPGQPVVVTQPPATAQVQTNDPPTSGGGAVGGATTGAIAGAIAGGPVGAAVGGIVGAVTGDVTEDAMTPATRTYVLQNPVQSVPVQGNVVVGSQIPDAVQFQQIPDSPYQYVYVNDQPVIVEPQTRKVLYVVR